MRFYSTLFLLIIIRVLIDAQDTIPQFKSFGILFGYQRAANNFFDIGFAREIGTEGNPLLFVTPKHKAGLFFNGHRYYNLNYSYNPTNKIKGLDFGYNSGGFLAIGLHLNYFQIDNDYRLGLKPEIGIIINRFQLLYGYNIKISGIDDKLISSHSIKIGCYFPILGKMNTKTFKTHQEKSGKRKK